jgi:hypothetical protein
MPSLDDAGAVGDEVAGLRFCGMPEVARSERVHFAVSVCGPFNTPEWAYDHRYTLMALENRCLSVDVDQVFLPREGVNQGLAAASCRSRGALPLPGKRHADRFAGHCRTS